MSQSHADVVRSVYSRWGQGRFREADLFADDLVFTTFEPQGDALTMHGFAAMTDWLRSFFAQWRNYRIEPHEFVDHGDRILVIARQSAEGKRSGVFVQMPVYHVWTFSGDKVVAFLATRDRGKAEAEAAASPGAPARARSGS